MEFKNFNEDLWLGCKVKAQELFGHQNIEWCVATASKMYDEEKQAKDMPTKPITHKDKKDGHWSARFGDWEARSCNENLTQEGEHTKVEVVRWQKGYCYTVAYYKNEYLVIIPDRIESYPKELVDCLRKATQYMLGKV